MYIVIPYPFRRLAFAYVIIRDFKAPREIERRADESRRVRKNEICENNERSSTRHLENARAYRNGAARSKRSADYERCKTIFITIGYVSVREEKHADK